LYFDWDFSKKNLIKRMEEKNVYIYSWK
jgi:hypothetical protein